MNTLTNLPVMFASFNILGLKLVPCIIVLALAVVLILLKIFVPVKITYVDPADGTVISVKKYAWLVKAPLYAAASPDKTFVGWTDAKGEVLYLNKEKVWILKPRTLYAVWEPESQNNMTLTINYKTPDGKLIKRRVIATNLQIPDVFDEEEEFFGWGTKPNGKAVFTNNTTELEVSLYSIFGENANIPEVTVDPSIEEIPEDPATKKKITEEVATTYIDDVSFNKVEIRYSRSFLANLIQSTEAVKEYYSDLKNYILSFKGVKSRISWKYDSYNRGRDQLFKIKLRGKTICMYCALDPNDFDVAKYHHEATDAKIFEDVPMLVKIKSNLGLRKAKEIVDAVMLRFDIEKNEKHKNVDYVSKYPYQTTEELLAQEQIKELTSQIDSDDKPIIGKVVVEKVVVAKEVVVEQKTQEVNEEEAE